MHSFRNVFSLPKLYRHAKRLDNCLLIKHGRHYCKTTSFSRKEFKSENELATSSSYKYDVFVDEESPIIFDIEQEREKFYEINDETQKQRKKLEDFSGISPQRGTTGVIEIEELIKILKRENAADIFVVKVPDTYSYVDYMVLASGKSARHMKAIGEFVRKVYKYKTVAETNIPPIEGKDSKDWLALDLGNIALHIMSNSARNYYDLESLWSVGKEFDYQYNIQKQKHELDYGSIFSNLIPV